MHVVHVITKGDVGGAQTHVVELAAAQVRSGLSVSVIAGTDGPALARIRGAGCDVSVLPALGDARTRLWQREALRQLGAAIDALEPDLVHAHSSNAGFVARLACRRRSLPCVYTAHGWPFQRGAAWRQRVLSFAGEFVGARAGDGVICLTEAEAERARRARVTRRDSMWVVPNGLADVPATFVRAHLGGPPRIVMVARFAPPKLQAALIDACAAMLDLDWNLSFVGEGPELEPCRSHGAARLGERVQFLGHRDDVPALLAEHDVLVLWSAYEGLPISVLEGMRAGLCCVGSDLPGLRELFEGDTGLIAASEAELVATMRSVVTDPERRAALGTAGRNRFTERYSIDAVERRTREIYDLVIKRTGNVRRSTTGS